MLDLFRHANWFSRTDSAPLSALLLLLASATPSICGASVGDWILSSISQTGSVDTTLATPYQATSESLTTLTILGSKSEPAVSLARNYVLAEPFRNTENLSRQIVAGVTGGSNVLSRIDDLISSQNPKDGGFGELAGWQSTPIDTSFALEALSVAGKANDRSVGSAVAYLTATQSADGSWRSDQEESPVYVTALALHALHHVRNSHNVSAQISAASVWLLAQRNSNGSWADTALTAQVLSALIPTFNDISPLQSSLDALGAQKASNGSFNNDAWDTAWALRALFLAGQPRTNPDEIVIRGRILDGDTALPLAGALVALSGAQSSTQTTTSNGVFAFRNLAPGSYTLAITRTDYGSVQASTKVAIGSFADFGDIRLLKSLMAPTTATIRGVVTDVDSGAPLAAATVQIEGGVSTTTASDGTYQLNDVMPGAVSMRAAAAGYGDSTASANLVAGSIVVFSPAMVRVPQPDPAATTIKGVVVKASDGAAIAGATVTISGPENRTLITGTGGLFTFTGIAAGAYQLAVTADGYGGASGAAAVETGTTANFGAVALNALVIVPGEPPPTTGTVRGVVTNAENGEPIYGAIVQLAGFPDARTDTAGRYAFTNVPAGSVQITVGAAGYLAAFGSGQLSGGGTLLYSPGLQYAPGAGEFVMQGTVTRADTNTPLDGVFVFVYQPTYRWNWTGADGRYRLGSVPAGDVLVLFRQDGYDDVFIGLEGRPGTLVDISPKMYRTGTSPANANSSTAIGHLVDSTTDLPVAGAVVTATWESTASGTPQTISQTATSDGNGLFRVEGIRKATVKLTVSASGYEGVSFDMPLPVLRETDIGSIRLRPEEVVELMPDATVSSAHASGVSFDAQSLTVSGQVVASLRNEGTALLDKPVVARAYTTAGDVVGDAIFTATLLPGAESTIAIAVNGTLPFRDAPLRVVVDADQVVAELNENNNEAVTNADCRGAPLARSSLSPVLKWRWNSANVLSTPVVGPLLDTDGDGKVTALDRTAVVFVSHTGFVDRNYGFLRAVWGDTGQAIWSVTSTDLRTDASAHPALGDIDGDGKPEVVAYRYAGGVMAINSDGTLKWKSTAPARHSTLYNYSAINLADLEGDGNVEILARTHVLNNDGTVRFSTTTALVHEAQAIAADIDGDGVQEVIMGGIAHSAAGTRLWTYAPLAHGFSAVGDFDRDGIPELVFTRPSGVIALVRNNGTEIWRAAVPGGGGGSPTILDVDQDGVPEIGVAGQTAYALFRADGSIRWTKPIIDSSVRTGSTSFDFEGDGFPEIAYNDQDYLRIYDGRNGTVVFSIRNDSNTGTEQPIVADVDGDGHAELIVESDIGTALGIRIFQNVNDDWMPTRGIWNQHAYHVTNVNDDASIPRHETPSWLANNTYRLNAFPDHNPLDLADLTVGMIRLVDNGAGNPTSLIVRVGNAGLIPARAGSTVALYSGDPAFGGLLLGNVTVPVLQAGESADLRLDGVMGVAPGAAVFAIMARQASVADCRVTNDVHSIVVAAINQAGSISVTTDKAVYGPAEDVAITVVPHNAGALDGMFSVAVRIVDVEGRVVTELAGEGDLMLAGNGQVTLTRAWNTADILVGDYRVAVELLGVDNVVLAEGSAGFRIETEADVELASISVATDRPSYNTTDSVGVEGLARNLATNVLLARAAIVVEMRDAMGTVVGTWSDAAADLAAGTSRSYEASLPLVASAQGTFSLHAVLRSATGAALASADTTFTVQELLSRSLSGELVVANRTLIVGEAQTCSGIVRVLGTQGLSNLPVRLAAVPLTGSSAETTVATHSLTLAAGGTQAINATFDTAPLAPGDYACALQYQDGNTWQTLAYKSFTVQVPPVALSGNVGIAEVSVHRRDPQICTYTVSNTGGGTAQDLLVERSLIAPDGSVASLLSSTITLAGNSSQNFVQSYDTIGLTEGSYRCRLETVWNSQRAMQGETGWELLPPVCPTPQPTPDLVDTRDDLDLIVNGSFEEYGKLNQGVTGTFASIPGWESKYGPLEIQTTALDGIPQKDGNARLELDSQNNGEATQWVPTDVGGRYELLIAYSPRVAVAGTDTNNVEIWWDGQHVKTLSGDAQGWREERIEVTAAKSLTALKLKATGTSDKLGGLIDQVRLYCIACRRSNLLNNGSFERHPRLATETSGFFRAIPGWTATTAEPFEVQHDASHAINVLDGHAQVEVDAQANARMAQDVATADGQQYVLDLFYAPRVPLPHQVDSNQVEIWWANQLLDTLRGGKNEWYMKRYTVSATDATSRLEFRGAGAGDTFGGVIDNVHLACQPAVNARLPAIVSTPVVVAMASEPWEYTLEIENVAADALHLTLEQAPEGLTLDADGVLRWNNPVRGEYTVSIRISDGCGGTGVQTFTLTVGWPEWCPMP